MTPPDLWRLSLENLWRTKLRSVLTTLGVIIGVASVIAMSAIGSGARQEVVRPLSRLLPGVINR